MSDICEARSFSCENKKAFTHLLDLVFVFRYKSHNKDMCIFYPGASQIQSK